MPSTMSTSCSSTHLDVELPLQQALALDIDLSTVAAARLLVTGSGVLFQPSMSQVAADPLQSRTRAADLSRPGYHGTTTWNWMRDGNASLRQRGSGKR